MSKKATDKLRADYLAKVVEMFTKAGEEVLQVKSNEIALPCVDSEGEEQFIVLTVKIPSGDRAGNPYDGYTEAEGYKISLAEKAEKEKAKAEEKAKKIAKDEKAREAKAKAKAEREAKGE